VCLDKVPKLVYGGHEHDVNVNLVKKSRDVRNSWGQVKVMGLPSLKRMAHRKEPLDIIIQNGPPESLPQIWEDREGGSVTNCFECFGDEGEALSFLNDHFVNSLGDPSA